MILQVPEGFPPGYYSGFSLMLWFVVIALFFLNFIVFLWKARGVEMESQKWLFISYGVASLGLGFTRIFFILGVYISAQYDFYTILGYISALAGMVLWIFTLEKYLVTKTKKVLTLITIVLLIIDFVALLGPIPRELALDLQYIFLPFSLGAIAILYFYIIAKATGDVRTKAIWILIGLILIVVAQVMDGQAFITAFPAVPLELAPVIMMAGILLFLISQIRK
ncbi:MAG: hypothetical protein EU544_03665 [Promethearchaeota archaeon]|nr:MAG: hypothetical protein EU544_03665 [Candidatus Lokiarchaeota archaeon]